MSVSFPFGNKELRIGLLGMTKGNAHPFSWGAMFNNYNREEMLKWTGELYPAIPAYLGKQPDETFGIPGARITHVCFSGYGDRAMAEGCAAAALIPHVTERPEDMVAEVDAVICATDIGSEHVERCRPFLEKGIPMFIDKPLTDNEQDLKTFVKWRSEGAHFISSSSMRYNKALEPFYENHYEFGRLRYICSPMSKVWETYGIHAVEGIFNLLGRGFISVQNTGTYESPMVHLYHQSGCYVDIPMGMGMIKIIIAGIRSREEGGRKVLLSEIKES